MKLFPYIILSALLVSCSKSAKSDLGNDKELNKPTAPKIIDLEKTEDTPSLPELKTEAQPKTLDFVDPETTNSLMTDADKKTVITPPEQINVPVPEQAAETAVKAIPPSITPPPIGGVNTD